MYNTELRPLKKKLKYDEFANLTKEKIKDNLIREVMPSLKNRNIILKI